MDCHPIDDQDFEIRYTLQNIKQTDQEWKESIESKPVNK